jgi:phosphatidylglycerophosphatase A
MKIKNLVLSCFGIGFLPIMPGTFGSLIMLGAFLAVHFLWPVQMISVIFLIAVIIISSILCIFYAKSFGSKDPGWVVIDELAGQAVALFPAAVTSGMVLPPAIAGFVLFRVFDIWKPSPIKEMETLRNGVGILADDLVAGVIAGTIVCIVTYLIRFAEMGH